MEEMNNEVLTGEVEELNTTTDNNAEVEDSGIGAVGLAIAGLAIIGAVAAGKAVYTGGKSAISKVKAKIDEKKNAEADAELLEGEVDDSDDGEAEEAVSETK